MCSLGEPQDLFGITQLSDIAKGLNYLHGKQIVHGDLKGVRISYNKVINWLTSTYIGKRPCKRRKTRSHCRLWAHSASFDHFNDINDQW